MMDDSDLHTTHTATRATSFFLALLFLLCRRILITMRSQSQGRGNGCAPAQQAASRRDRWLGGFRANRYRVLTHRCISSILE
jgi:hypothetical protein